MSDYNRTTRECPVSQLHPEILRAFQSYFQEHNLGDLETETLLCCETISTKKEFSGLASMLKNELETSIRIGMILTSKQLIWVRKGDQSDARLTAADLNFIQVRAYTSFFTKDTGLEVFGYIGDSNTNVRGYIGMGSEPAAQKFCEEVRKAIIIKNPELQRKFPKWMGG